MTSLVQLFIIIGTIERVGRRLLIILNLYAEVSLLDGFFPQDTQVITLNII